MAVYSPVIYGFARKRGLQDADAADVMQDVLRSVTTAIDRLDYDPRKGRFRGWLFTLTTNRVMTLLSTRNKKPRGTGDSNVQSMLSAHPDNREGMEADWEQDYQKSLAAVALDEVKSEFNDRIWNAFWRTAVEGKAATDVARELGMSAGAVYVAKSRVLARVREVVQRELDEGEE